MLIKYQNYYIATDAHHVTQHRRIVTPLFYWKLKSIKFVKHNHEPDYVFGLWGGHSVWASGDCAIMQPDLIRKLDMVTMVFNKGEI